MSGGVWFSRNLYRNAQFGGAVPRPLCTRMGKCCAMQLLFLMVLLSLVVAVVVLTYSSQ